MNAWFSCHTYPPIEKGLIPYIVTIHDIRWNFVPQTRSHKNSNQLMTIHNHVHRWWFVQIRLAPLVAPPCLYIITRRSTFTLCVCSTTIRLAKTMLISRITFAAPEYCTWRQSAWGALMCSREAHTSTCIGSPFVYSAGLQDQPPNKSQHNISKKLRKLLFAKQAHFLSLKARSLCLRTENCVHDPCTSTRHCAGSLFACVIRSKTSDPFGRAD